MRLAVIVPAGQGGGVPNSWRPAAATGVSFVHNMAGVPLPEADAVVLTCALDTDAAIASAVRSFAANGGPVLGLGVGFGGLCTLGLLPGRVDTRACSAGTVGYLRTEGRLTPFSAAIPAGRVLQVACETGYAYCHPAPIDLDRAGQIIFRYCDAWAGVSDKDNLFGASAAIAGLSNAGGNVVGVAASLLFASPPAQDPVDQLFVSASFWLAQKGRARQTPSRPLAVHESLKGS